MKKAEIAQEYFRSVFSKDSESVYFAHGRLEILGNHTDHNKGLCLVAGSDLGITAGVSKRSDGIVEIASEGFEPFSFPADELEKIPSETGTSLALAKGVLFALRRLGYGVGGFSLAAVNDLPIGGGLSSSAAFEALIAQVVNELYNENKIPSFDLAFASQYAERIYYGKPCGILDQIGACYGGICYLDLANPDKPIIEPLPFKLPLKVVLLQTKSSHAGLDDLYASIPDDMFAVAKTLFGKQTLREVPQENFFLTIANPTMGVSESAKLRAQHYYDENQRVLDARDAIVRNDAATFLQCVRQNAFSMAGYLHNTCVPGRYEGSPQQLIDFAIPYLGGGACRLMGGGFAGSILCFVPEKAYPNFVRAMKAHIGEENVIDASFYPGGPKRIK